MNLEQIDGFLAALICGPELVLPSEYLPVIWGDDIVLEDTFSAQPMLEDFLSLIMRHWNNIAETLHSGEMLLPLLVQDENGITHANDGQMASYVEWSYAKPNGLQSWMTRNMVAGLCRYLRWHTNMTPIPRCVPTRNQSALRHARN